MLNQEIELKITPKEDFQKFQQKENNKNKDEKYNFKYVLWKIY